MIYLLENMNFYVMPASKVELKVVRAAEPNQYFRHRIDVLKAKWYQFHDIDSDEDNDNQELEEVDFLREGSYKVCCKRRNRQDDDNYYLAKLMTDIYETEESEKDDNNYEMPAHQKFITCSYLEIIKT